MKRNFIVTTSLIDTWEINENNFLLGKWCELNENNDLNKHSNNITVADKHHWYEYKKRNKDYKYLKEKLEYLLEIISETLSKLHNVNENKEYWRVIIYPWLAEYAIVIFDRWESVRIFFEKNRTEKFYSNYIFLNDLNYLPRKHMDFVEMSQTDEWNHIIFLRIFNFFNFKNLSLIKKEAKNNNFKTKISLIDKNSLLLKQCLNLVDKIISKFAFKFNNIILESFYFPKKEFFKICLKYKLIPSKYSNFFDFDFYKTDSSTKNKRFELKDLLSKIKTEDKFIKFFLSNLHKDLPKSYLENFGAIKKKFLPYAKNIKTIFSMTSIERNDNFKTYLAETKKKGSKHIRVMHGGGLMFNENEHSFGFFEKVSDKIIKYDKEKQNNLYHNLCPTLPVIKLKNSKKGNYCSIVFVEQRKYLIKFPESLILDQSIDFFNELTQFVHKLNPEIKRKIKFRVKRNIGYNCEERFSKIFGKEHIDKVSFENPFKNTLSNSKLIISTYPQTVFSEAMYYNVPTILIIKQNYYQFKKLSLDIFNILKENKIAFDDFDEAKEHINKNWENINLWWKNENVQYARKKFLSNFFNVKTDWYKEWSDYISVSSFS